MMKRTLQKGFTLVELMIVIAVIAILAAIVIVAFNGIQQRAREVVVEADLDAAAKQLELYKVKTSLTESYPAAIDCTTSPVTDSVCIKNTTQTTYEYSRTESGKSFCVSGVSGNVGKSTTPNGNIEDEVCDGHTPPSGSTGGGGPTLPPAGWTDIATGNSHTCGIYLTKVYCWGTGGNGELGNGQNTNNPVKQAVITTGALSGKTVTSVVAQAYGTCAVADGGAYCWGLGSTRRLGNNTSVASNVPVLATGSLTGKNVTAVATHYSNSCAVADGAAYCWGTGTNGRNGDNSTAIRPTPVAVNTSGVLNGLTVTGIASASGASTSQGHTCVVANAKPYCWGYGTSGQLGNSASLSSQIPVAVTTTGALSGKTVTAIATGQNFSCAIADGKIYCWGGGGIGGTSSPTAVGNTYGINDKVATQISGGDEHMCAVAGGQVYCWGTGDQGRLGVGNDSSFQSAPKPVEGLLTGKTVVKVASGGLHTCAVTTSAELYCWGFNAAGQLGNESTVTAWDPVLVPNPN